ncbi:hypothetical protein K438DRAFT_1783407 [Mycena galopus ATCC 62051]|nr:hypothetical protein K438DRAFT_1783407 [Mycena galopus ATCC 62051]
MQAADALSLTNRLKGTGIRRRGAARDVLALLGVLLNQAVLDLGSAAHISVVMMDPTKAAHALAEGNTTHSGEGKGRACRGGWRRRRSCLQGRQHQGGEREQECMGTASPVAAPRPMSPQFVPKASADGVGKDGEHRVFCGQGPAPGHADGHLHARTPDPRIVRQKHTNWMSCNFDAMLDGVGTSMREPGSGEASGDDWPDDYLALLLHRTLWRRRLSESLIHSAFAGQALEEDLPRQTPVSRAEAMWLESDACVVLPARRSALAAGGQDDLEGSACAGPCHRYFCRLEMTSPTNTPSCVQRRHSLRFENASTPSSPRRTELALRQSKGMALRCSSRKVKVGGRHGGNARDTSRVAVKSRKSAPNIWQWFVSSSTSTTTIPELPSSLPFYILIFIPHLAFATSIRCCRARLVARSPPRTRSSPPCHPHASLLEGEERPVGVRVVTQHLIRLRLELVTQEMGDFQNVLELLADHRVFAIRFKPLFRTSSFTELYSYPLGLACSSQRVAVHPRVASRCGRFRRHMIRLVVGGGGILPLHDMPALRSGWQVYRKNIRLLSAALLSKLLDARLMYTLVVHPLRTIKWNVQTDYKV